LIEQGRIEKKAGEGLYEVRLESQQEGCKGCALKGECGGRAGSLTLAAGNRDFNPGDAVELDFSEKNEALRFVWVFLFPLLFGFTGMAMSFMVFFPRRELPAFAFFAGFFALGLAFARLKEKTGKARLPRIL